MVKQEIICGVYCFRNVETNEILYIGSSCNVRRRLQYHSYPSEWKHQPNFPLYKAMQELGDVIQPTILYQCCKPLLRFMEQLAIDLYNPKLNVHKALTGKSRKDYTHDYNTNQVRNYNNRMCNYNGELVSFCALRTRFYRSGIPNASEVAFSYLI